MSFDKFSGDNELFSRDIVANTEKNTAGEMTYSLVIRKLVLRDSGLEVPCEVKKLYYL